MAEDTVFSWMWCCVVGQAILLQDCSAFKMSSLVASDTA